jgi:hypothetical protein
MTNPTGTTLDGVITTGITATLNQLGARQDCRPLTWSVEASTAHLPVLHLIGLASADHTDGPEAATAVGQWAQAWNLEPVEQSVSWGTIEYQGRIGQFLVTVWAVVDRAAFEADEQR